MGLEVELRTEERFLLHKEISLANTLITPEKPFVLPIYVERYAKKVEKLKPELCGEGKGWWTRKGLQGKI